MTAAKKVDGKAGGSPPADPRVAKLEADMAKLKALMRANGWSLPEEDGE